MSEMPPTDVKLDPTSMRAIARFTLVPFVLTFIVSRVLVYLIMARTIPDLYMHLGGTHIHHLNYGIFLLSGVGAYLLFVPLSVRSLLIPKALGQVPGRVCQRLRAKAEIASDSPVSQPAVHGIQIVSTPLPKGDPFSLQSHHDLPRIPTTKETDRRATE